MTAAVTTSSIKFADLNLNPAIAKAIDLCGYTQPTPVQEKSIPVILEGKDVIVSAQTGTGKTASFVLPALNHLSNRDDEGQTRTKSPRILILTPTRELATQITKAATLYGKFCRFNIVSLVGGMPYHNQIRDLQRGADIIVATPGRLIDHVEQKRVDLSRIEIFILDEADRMLDMGFVDDIEKVASIIPKEHQTLLFSATMDKKVASVSRHLLVDPVRIDLSSEKLTATNVEQILYRAKSPHHKLRLLVELLSENIFKAIIFSATKINADRIADRLLEAGFSAAALHGDLRQNVRNRVLEEFRRGKTQFVVATDVAARGLDVSDISHVINFDLPKNAEDYVHRIGRTGRAGKAGVAISFVLAGDMRNIQFIERYIGQRLTLDTAPGPVGLEASSENFTASPAGSDRNSRGRSDGGFKKKSYSGSGAGAGRSAYSRSDSDRPSRGRSDSDRPSSFEGKRREFSSSDRKPFGSDRPFNRDGASSDRPQRSRPFDSERSGSSDRPQRSRPFDSERKPFGASSDRPQRSRPFDSERSGSDRPQRSGSSFGGEKRSFAPAGRSFSRDGASSDRPQRSRPFDSERSGSSERSFGGEKRSFAPAGRSFNRDGASSDRPQRAGSDRPFSGEKRSFAPAGRSISRDGASADRAPRGRAVDGERRQPYTPSSDRPIRAFAGRPAGRDGAGRPTSRDGAGAARPFKKSIAGGRSVAKHDRTDR